MAKYTPEFKENVRQSYVGSNKSLAAVAAEFGVSTRTVELWAAAGKWDAIRRGQNIVQFSPSERKPRAISRSSYDINEPEIIDGLICGLNGLLLAMMGKPEDNRIIDIRTIGTTATAMVKLLEHRRKIHPPSILDLAGMAIDLGYTPQSFMQALNELWQQQA